MTARLHTEALLEMMEDGLISAEDIVRMAMSYMSEAEVKDMMECNELLDPSYIDEDYDDSFPLSLEYDEGE
jgi:hypothetical protein